MELATRLARIIPRLSLTAAAIKKLPNTYAENEPAFPWKG